MGLRAWQEQPVSVSHLGVPGVPPEGFREQCCAATVWSPPSGGALGPWEAG